MHDMTWDGFRDGRKGSISLFLEVGIRLWMDVTTLIYLVTKMVCVVSAGLVLSADDS